MLDDHDTIWSLSTPVAGFMLTNSEPLMTSPSFQFLSDLLVLFGTNKTKIIPEINDGLGQGGGNEDGENWTIGEIIW